MSTDPKTPVILAGIRTFKKDVEVKQAQAATPPPAPTLNVELTPKQPSSTPIPKSPLTPGKQVFDVERAFQDDGSPEGTIVTDRKRTGLSFGATIKSAFGEWWSKTRSSVESNVEKIEQIKRDTSPTITSAQDRTATIQEAALLTTQAPRDDHRAVLSKVRTFARDTEVATGKPFTIKAPTPVPAASWGTKIAPTTNEPSLPLGVIATTPETTSPASPTPLPPPPSPPAGTPSTAAPPTPAAKPVPVTPPAPLAKPVVLPKVSLSSYAPSAPKRTVSLTPTVVTPNVSSTTTQKSQQKSERASSVFSDLAPAKSPVPSTPASDVAPLVAPPTTPKYTLAHKPNNLNPVVASTPKTPPPQEEEASVDTPPPPPPIPVPTPEEVSASARALSARTSVRPLPRTPPVTQPSPTPKIPPAVEVQPPPAPVPPPTPVAPPPPPVPTPIPTPVPMPEQPPTRTAKPERVESDALTALRARLKRIDESSVPVPQQREVILPHIEREIPPTPEYAPTPVTRVPMDTPPEPEANEEEEATYEDVPVPLPPTPEAHGPARMDAAISRARTLIDRLMPAMLVIGVIVVCVVLGTGAAFFITQRAPDDAAVSSPPPAPHSFVTTSERVIVPLTEDRAAFAASMRAVSGTEGITEITVADSAGKDALLVTALAERFMAGAPRAFVRALSPAYMVGVVGGTTPAPFIILESANFDVAFAGMLAWERTIHRDLAPILFGTDETTAPESSAFTDSIIENHTVRTGSALVYTIVSAKRIIITTSTDALSTILNQMR